MKQKGFDGGTELVNKDFMNCQQMNVDFRWPIMRSPLSPHGLGFLRKCSWGFGLYRDKWSENRTSADAGFLKVFVWSFSSRSKILNFEKMLASPANILYDGDATIAESDLTWRTSVR